MKKLLALALAMLLPAIASAIGGVSISTTSYHSGAQDARVLRVNPGETFTYSVSGTWVGLAILQRSFDATNYQPAFGPTGVAISTGGLSGAGNSGGTYSGTLTHESESRSAAFYRFFVSSYTSGGFVFALADANDCVQEFVNKKNLPVLTINDDTITTANDVTITGALTASGGGVFSPTSISASANISAYSMNVTSSPINLGLSNLAFDADYYNYSVIASSPIVIFEPTGSPGGISMFTPSAGTNLKWWQMNNRSGRWTLEAVNDGFDSVANAIVVSKSNFAVTGVGIKTTGAPGSTLDVNGDATIRGQFTVASGTATINGSSAAFLVGSSTLSVKANGYINYSQFTKAKINATTPAVGDMVTCIDCARTYTLCVATGTSVGQFREVGLATGCY